MPEEKWIECIHKEIDGLNSPEESSRLRTYLVDHPEEQRLFDDLMHLTGLMKHVCVEDPSPALKSRIINEIPYNRYPHYKLSYSETLIKNIRHGFTTGDSLRMSLRYASAFAAGFVICMMMFFAYENKVHQNFVTDSTYLQGAMGLPAELGPFEEADRAAIDLPSVRGEFKIYYNRDFIQARLELKSAGTVEAEILFDENDLSFSGWRLLGTPETCQMTAGVNKISLNHDGDRSYWLIFTNKTPNLSKLTLKLREAGSISYEAGFLTGAIRK